jgi:hypothetical protein
MSSSCIPHSEDPLDQFRPVLAVLQLSKVPAYAASIREKADSQAGSAPVEIPVVGSPRHGSFHILFPIDFSDGTRWLLKVPINGTPDKWNKRTANALRSEALTMRLIRRRTTIPIPEVFDFGLTSDNRLKCPYLLLSCIPGVPLQSLWFDMSLSKDERY